MGMLDKFKSKEQRYEETPFPKAPPTDLAGVLAYLHDVCDDVVLTTWGKSMARIKRGWYCKVKIAREPYKIELMIEGDTAQEAAFLTMDALRKSIRPSGL